MPITMDEGSPRTSGIVMDDDVQPDTSVVPYTQPAKPASKTAPKTAKPGAGKIPSALARPTPGPSELDDFLDYVHQAVPAKRPTGPAGSRGKQVGRGASGPDATPRLSLPPVTPVDPQYPTWGNFYQRSPLQLMGTVAQALIPGETGAESRSALASIPENMIESSYQNAKEAFRSLDEGEYGKAIAHGISSVPLIGEPLVGYARKAEAGEWRPMLGDFLGDVTSLYAPKVLGKTVGRVARPFRGVESSSSAAARELSIPTPPSRYFEQPPALLNIAENMAGGSGFGAPVMGKLIRKGNEAINAAHSALRNKISASTETPMQLGKTVRKAVGTADEAEMDSLIHKEAQRVKEANLENGLEHKRAEGQVLDAQDQHMLAKQQALEELAHEQSMTGAARSDLELGNQYQATKNAEANTRMAEFKDRFAELDEKTRLVKDPVLPPEDWRGVVDIRPIRDFARKVSKDVRGTGGAVAELKGVDSAKVLNEANILKRLGIAIEVPDPVTGEMQTIIKPYAGFKDVRDIQSGLKGIARDHADIINTRFPGMIDKTIATMEEQLKQTAKQLGVEDIYRPLMDDYRAFASEFRDGIVPDLLKGNPEDIAKKVWRPGQITDARQVADSLKNHPNLWNDFRRRGVDDLYKRSMVNGELNSEKLQANFDDLGPEMQELMFGGSKNAGRFQDRIGVLGERQIPFDLEAPPVPGEVTPTKQRLTLESPEKKLRTVVKSKPEDIVAQALNPSSGATFAETLQNSGLDKATLDAIRAETIGKIFSQTSDAQVGFGSRLSNSEATSNFWNSLHPEQKAFIGGSDLATLEKIIEAQGAVPTDKLKGLTQSSFTRGGTGMAAASALFELLASNFGYPPKGVMTGAVLGTSWFGPKFLAHALTSDIGRKWLTEGLTSKDLPKWIQKMPNPVRNTAMGQQIYKKFVKPTVKIGVQSAPSQLSRPPLPEVLPPPPQSDQR